MTKDKWRQDDNVVRDEKGNIVADCEDYHGDFDDDVSETHARRIVQCVNSHDALLEVCKELVDSFREVERMTWACDMCKKAEQLIAEAK